MPHRIKTIICRENNQVRCISLRNTVILHAESPRTVISNQFQPFVNLLITHHLANMQPHMQYLQHIGRPQRIPRVEDIVMAKTNINSRFEQLFHTGDPKTDMSKKEKRKMKTRYNIKLLPPNFVLSLSLVP